VQYFGQRRVHALALAGSENDDIQGHGRLPGSGGDFNIRLVTEMRNARRADGTKISVTAASTGYGNRMVKMFMSDALRLAPAQHSAQSGQKKGAWWKGGGIAMAALALAACSALSTTYNNAPTLITWWANSYFDLDNDQEALLKDRIRALRVWHRTELPVFARAFGELQTRIGRPVEAADVDWLFDESKMQMRHLVEHAAPDAAELATHLRSDNIAALKRKMEKKDAEFEDDYVTASPEKQQDKRYDRVLSEAERWYGSFSGEQKKQIRAMSDALPGNYALVLADRRRRQAELVTILNAAIDKSAGVPETTRRLARWADFEQGRTPEFQAYATRYRRELERLFAAIANLATPDQRQAAQKNVGEYMDQFNTLAVAGN
jgi:hypothetical protein